MSGWQKAGDVPGLMSARPPARDAAIRAAAGHGRSWQPAAASGGALTIDFGILGVVLARTSSPRSVACS